MSKLSCKKININDYSTNNQADISKLARSLNPLMDDLERLFRKNLTVSDNLPFQYVTFSCSVDANGTPTAKTKITSSLTTTIKGCIVVNASNSTTSPTSAVYVYLSFSGSEIEVKKVFGLPAETTFDITILLVS
jgi:hypothetical protein